MFRALLVKGGFLVLFEEEKNRKGYSLGFFLVVHSFEQKVGGKLARRDRKDVGMEAESVMQ